ncbi:MAG: hypothetical protein LBD21_02080, partial [Tannerellaceae bacterium]|nr:hypothetical protein [Tannerellaceae bacterium]
LQALFTREEILGRYDHAAKQEIVALLLLHAEQLDDLGLGRLGEVEVMTWIMYDDGYEPVVQHFSPANNLNKEWLLMDTSMREDMIAFAKNYIQ